MPTPDAVQQARIAMPCRGTRRPQRSWQRSQMAPDGASASHGAFDESIHGQSRGGGRKRTKGGGAAHARGAFHNAADRRAACGLARRAAHAGRRGDRRGPRRAAHRSLQACSSAEGLLSPKKQNEVCSSQAQVPATQSKTQRVDDWSDGTCQTISAARPASVRRLCMVSPPAFGLLMRRSTAAPPAGSRSWRQSRSTRWCWWRARRGAGRPRRCPSSSWRTRGVRACSSCVSSSSYQNWLPADLRCPRRRMLPVLRASTPAKAAYDALHGRHQQQSSMSSNPCQPSHVTACRSLLACGQAHRAQLLRHVIAATAAVHTFARQGLRDRSLIVRNV